MLTRTTIKQAFGGEVPFTKFIATNQETSNRLLEALDLSYDAGYTVTPESATVDSKRVDLVVRSGEEIVLLIESQDASGWLDSIHTSKLTYYMYDHRCFEGVLLCEDADEHIKGYVRYLNENTTFSITLVNTLVYETQEGDRFVDFIPLIRPTATRDRRVRRVANTDYSAETAECAEVAQELNDRYPGLFTNVASRWCSRNNVANTGWNVAVGIDLRAGAAGGVGVYHRNRATPEQRELINNIIRKHGFPTSERRDMCSTTGPVTEEKGIPLFRELVEALESGKIVETV